MTVSKAAVQMMKSKATVPIDGASTETETSDDSESIDMETSSNHPTPIQHSRIGKPSKV